MVVYPYVVMIAFGHKSKWRIFKATDEILVHEKSKPAEGKTASIAAKAIGNFQLLNNLPTDCLIEVLSFLNVYEVMSLSRTTIYFHNVVYQDSRIWFNYHSLIRHWMRKDLLKNCCSAAASDEIMNLVERNIQLKTSNVKYSNHLSRLVHHVYLLPIVYIQVYN